MLEIKSIKPKKTNQVYNFVVKLENKGKAIETTLTASELYSYRRFQQEILRKTGMMFRYRSFSCFQTSYINEEWPGIIEILLNRMKE
jgi:hypothetical protein